MTQIDINTQTKMNSIIASIKKFYKVDKSVKGILKFIYRIIASFVVAVFFMISGLAVADSALKYTEVVELKCNAVEVARDRTETRTVLVSNMKGGFLTNMSDYPKYSGILSETRDENYNTVETNRKEGYLFVRKNAGNFGITNGVRTVAISDCKFIGKSRMMP